MDYLTSLTNDEIMIQEKLKLVSLRKTIYSYLNYYISRTKLEGKFNVLDVEKLKTIYRKMIMLILEH